jgi:transmembrane sensor
MNRRARRHERIAREAARWVLRLPGATEIENATFMDWIKQSRDHVDHFMTASQVDRRLEGLDLSRLAIRSPRDEPQAHRAIWSAPGRLVTGLTALLAVLCISVFHYVQANTLHQVYSTAIGQQLSVDLPDGSEVILNTASSVDVHVSPFVRKVKLNAGEAVFRVAHEKLLLVPFRVTTEDAVVEAVGTRFNVYRQAEGSTLVAVLEGIVDIHPRLNRATLTRVRAGSEARVHGGRRVESVASADLARVNGWVRHRLVFSGEPLSSVVRELNRYSPRYRFEVLDARAANLEIGATFDSTSMDSVVEALQMQVAISVEVSGDRVGIRSREGRGGAARSRK